MFAEINHHTIDVSQKREGGFSENLLISKSQNWSQVMEDLHWSEHGKKINLGIYRCRLDGNGGSFTLPKTTAVFVGGIAVFPEV